MSRNYFNCLNYTLANEDTALELDILPPRVSHLMSVAGSGGRVLPLLARHPKRVTCVDLSQEQLYLTELRFESLRALSHAEFLAFWGYPPCPAEPEDRKQLFKRIRLQEATREFFVGLFKSIGWESILYFGKWEKTIGKLSAVNRRLTGLRGVGLFTSLTHVEHSRYLKEKFPLYAWAATLSLLGNAGIFNALLYKGHFPKKNITESNFKFYRNAFQRVFDQGPARNNFLLQLVFFGKILFAEGNPVECDPEVYVQAQKGLAQAKIKYTQGNIIQECAQAKQPVDFLSLSDVPSYFSGLTENRFMQEVRSGLSNQGIAVIRNYLRVPQFDETGFERVTSDYQESIKKEKVQLYQVDILKKIPEKSGKKSKTQKLKSNVSKLH